MLRADCRGHRLRLTKRAYDSAVALASNHPTHKAVLRDGIARFHRTCDQPRACPLCDEIARSVSQPWALTSSMRAHWAGPHVCSQENGFRIKPRNLTLARPGNRCIDSIFAKLRQGSAGKAFGLRQPEASTWGSMRLAGTGHRQILFKLHAPTHCQRHDQAHPRKGSGRANPPT